mmetsp:Transcript_20157/g.71282  ORF Transcript_20157/g.71282 Transcript_20157/m.71282 type:complete len:406 (+) Transcript_20157:430-1647(+)
MQPAVDPDDARLDARAHAVRAAQVAGPHRPGQAVPHAVGVGDDLLLGVERVHRHDGPEDLLGRAPRVGRQPRDHARFDEVAAVERRRQRRRLAAALDRAALLARQGDVRAHLLEVHRGGERAQPRRLVHRVAALHLLDGRHEGSHVPLEQRPLHEDARARQAHLALVEEGGAHRAGDGLLEVAVREDDGGVLAAELERQLLEHGRGGARDVAARDGAAREGDHPDVLVRHDGGADLGAEPVHDVEHAGRQADVRGDLGEHAGGARRQLGGLGDDGVAHRQARRHLPRQEVQWQVPGRDEAAHADGVAQRVVDGVRHVVEVALAVPQLTGEESKVGDGARDVHRRRHLQRLARVLRLQARQFIRALRDAVRNSIEDVGALRGGEVLPWALSRRLGRGSSCVGVGGA